MKRYLVPVMVAAAVTAAPADAAVLAPAVIDTAPDAIHDIGVAPDGTGALVYAKGRRRLRRRSSTTGRGARRARRPDDGLAEDQPRVAVGNGGRVLVGYRDDTGGSLRWRLIETTGARASAEAADPERRRRQPDRRRLGPRHEPGRRRVRRMGGAQPRDAAAATRAPGDSRARPPRGACGSRSDIRATEHRRRRPTGPTSASPSTARATARCCSTRRTTPTRLRRLDGVPADARRRRACRARSARRITGTDHQLDLDMAADRLAWTAGSAMYPNGGHVVGVPVAGETAGSGGALRPAHPASENDNAERPDVALNATGAGLFAAEPNQRAGVWGGALDGDRPPARRVRLDAPPIEPAGRRGPGRRRSATAGAVWSPGRATSPMAPPGRSRSARRVFDAGAFAADELLLSTPRSARRRSPPSRCADGGGASRLGDTAVLIEQDDGTDRRRGRPLRRAADRAGRARRRGPAASPAHLRLDGVRGDVEPAASYKVLVDEQVAGTVGAGTTRFTPAADLAAGATTWRVVAVDGSARRPSSPARTVTVAADRARRRRRRRRRTPRAPWRR